jgi:glycosyltransferase involved in cell wall biosynthesis
MRDIINEELNVPKERIQVILNGMDTSHFRPPSEEEALLCRKKFDVAEEDNVLCIVGRLDWVKGHDVLFEALRMIQAEGDSFTLLCAGTGGYGEEIQNLASELGIRDAIKFLGFTEPRAVYWASDVIVLPSRREGFACATAEAMPCGTVPIRTPTAGASDQIDDEENGFIVPFDAPEELARRIRFLLYHPQERQKMSAAARTTAADRFALESSVDQFESLYSAVIDD